MMARSAAASVAVLVAGLVASAQAALKFNGSQYSDAGYDAYWYVLPGGNQIKIFWSYNYGFNFTAAGKWLGLGFRGDAASSTMGPGVFYTGQSDTHEVTARQVTSAENSFPVAWTDATLVESGCQTTGTTFTCYIIRDIDGSATVPNVNLGGDGVALLHASGGLSNGITGTIGFHFTYFGYSAGLNLVSMAPQLPILQQAGVITVQWSPTPTEELDVYMSGNFSSVGGLSQSRWVGFGVGSSGTSMGPGEFYTGQSDTLQITNR